MAIAIRLVTLNYDNLIFVAGDGDFKDALEKVLESGLNVTIVGFK